MYKGKQLNLLPPITMMLVGGLFLILTTGKSASLNCEKLERNYVHCQLPQIYVIPTSAANAFATGRNPNHSAIAVTEGLIKLLSEDELEAVIAHELSHIKNRDTLTQTVAATLAGAISLLAEIIRGLWFFGDYRNSLRFAISLLTVLLAPLTATIIQLAISRTREYAADAGAASLTGNPRSLANALERLENNRKIPLNSNAAFAPLLIINPISGELMSRLFSTHPPTQARIQQLLTLESKLGDSTVMINKSKPHSRNRVITSAAIILATLGLAYAPIPGLQKTVVVVSGTELQESLQVLEAKFEQENPTINLELKFQGSQDIVNNYIDKTNDFKPTVLIPASSEFLDELSHRYRTQIGSEPFYESPQPIAKTILVGIAWPERGKVLFPNDRFSWQAIEQAMQARNWQAIGGQSNWGSFDFMTTDPTRSNSGQITLSLWLKSKLKANTFETIDFNNPAVESLVNTVKRSVYQPPRSTDILLQEFITRGPNDADVATVYESIALYRWQQAAKNQEKPYQIYYLDPTVETVATAAIVRQDVDSATAKAAKTFISFLIEPEQQKVFVQHGFRPVNNSIDLQAVHNSPWSQAIPGVQVNPLVQAESAPDQEILGEIQRLWQRTN